MSFQVKIFEAPDAATLEAQVNEWLRAAKPQVLEITQSESGLGVGRILSLTALYRVTEVDPSFARTTESFPRSLPVAFR